MKKISYFFISTTLLSILCFNVFAQEKKAEIPAQNKKITPTEIKKIEKISEDDFESQEEVKPENDLSRFNNIAVVQVLNKTTAKTSILNLKIGEKISFGSLKIIAHKCWQSPLEQKPENKILLEVFEFKNESEEKSQEKRIFYGWMFSSSPSISSLENPIYDITALNCKNK
jgi:hypothetical protein